MKRFTKYNKTLLFLSTFILAGLNFSCRDDVDVFKSETFSPMRGGLVLSTNAVTTRADEHFGDDPYAEGTNAGEELIATAELYFFKSIDDEAAAFHHVTVTDIDKMTIAELTLKVPMNKEEYFVADRNNPDKKTAYIYALVNLPESTTLPAENEATIEKLKLITVESGEFVSVSMQNFVMRGGSTVTLAGTGTGREITGWIPVERLAAKVRLFASIHEKIYLDKDGKTIYQKEDESDEDFLRRREEEKWEVWESRPTLKVGDNEPEPNVWLYFYNFATKGRIDGYTGYTGKTDDKREELLGYESIDRSEAKRDFAHLVETDVALEDYAGSNPATNKIIREDFPYTHEKAFYSYPNQWNSGSIEERRATNVTLRLAWERVWDSESKGDNKITDYFYYQIPVNRIATSEKEKDRLDPNTYYRIKIDIAMLGSRDLGSPLDITASYEVLPWTTADVDVSIKGRRYLVVNETELVMNNVHTIQIPFSSSHPVKVEKCYVTYFRYNDIWGTDKYTGNPDYNWANPTHNKKEFESWLTAAENQLAALGGKEAEEGPLENVSFDNKTQNLLYYKKKYFYDEYYDELNEEGGYRYYVGREHPITIQPELRYQPTGLTGTNLTAWQLFNRKFDNLGAVYDYTVNNERNVVDFTHPLVQWKEVRTGNNSGSVRHYVPELHPRLNNSLWDEFSRIEIVMVLRHADRPADEHLFEETVHITQYPAMYVEVSHDYGKIYESNKVRGNEYVIVQGNSTEDYSEDTEWSTQWFEVSGYVTYLGSVNNNPNMYLIHTTQLSEEDNDYIIGDPRSLYYNNNLGDNTFPLSSDTEIEYDQNKLPVWTGFKKSNSYTLRTPHYLNYDYNIFAAPHVKNREGAKVYINRYYPTDEISGAGNKENFIAPSFRVASSFGKVSLQDIYSINTLLGTVTWSDLKWESRKQARRRCASYQEAGRPAGRWRVPTFAEIKYLLRLSTDGKIPHLFGLQDKDELIGYWSSTGLVGVNLVKKTVEYADPSDLDSPPAVRCVYDEWYWTRIDQQIKYKPYPLEREYMWGDVEKDNTQTW